MDAVTSARREQVLGRSFVLVLHAQQPALTDFPPTRAACAERKLCGLKVEQDPRSRFHKPDRTSISLVEIEMAANMPLLEPEKKEKEGGGEEKGEEGGKEGEY